MLLTAASRIGCVLAIAVAVMLAGTRLAAAQIGSDRYASIVVDAATGAIVSEANMDEPRFPASLTKMMTLYMLFEALRDRRVHLDQFVPVSLHAASMAPSKLGLVPTSRITVEQAILSLVTKSANDAASALGELLGGDEDRFAEMMTLRARALGMARTQFRNASGLPDYSQFTSARDMATLARHLIQDFPGYYHYFSTPYFLYGGRVIRNHQRLLEAYPGADGLKTGYTDASGFNVVTSAVRGGVRLVGVVMGASSGSERDVHMASLLDQGFERLGVPTVMVRRDPPPRLPPLVTFAHAASQAPKPAAIHRLGKPRLRTKPTALGQGSPRIVQGRAGSDRNPRRGATPARLAERRKHALASAGKVSTGAAVASRHVPQPRRQLVAGKPAPSARPTRTADQASGTRRPG